MDTKRLGRCKMQIIITSAILLFLAILVIYFNLINRHEVTIAYVDDEPITLNEFNRVLYQKKASVFEYFKKKYSAQSEEEFWQKNFNGEIPNEFLKKMTLDECVNIKVQQILAKQNGIQKDISYKTFLKEFMNENESRQKATQQNKVIYGPIKYKETDYFNHTFAKTVISLKEKMKNNEIPIDNQILEKYYSENQSKRYSSSQVLLVHCISLSYIDKDSNEDLLKKDKMKNKVNEAAKRINSGEDFDTVAELYNEQNKVIVTEFSDETARINDRNIVYQIASKVPIGKVSTVFEGNGSYNIIKCVQKQTKSKNFGELKSQVEIDYVDEMYNARVDKKLKNVIINIVNKVYEKYIVS